MNSKQVTDAEAGDAEYTIKYWAKNDTDTRVLGTMIVFPVESQALMDEYSTRLFPKLRKLSVINKSRP